MKPCAAKELDEMIAAWGASEDELMTEYEEIRKSAREKRDGRKNEAILLWGCHLISAGLYRVGRNSIN